MPEHHWILHTNNNGMISQMKGQNDVLSKKVNSTWFDDSCDSNPHHCLGKEQFCNLCHFQKDSQDGKFYKKINSYPHLGLSEGEWCKTCLFEIRTESLV